jgi:ATP-dependent DNA helicase RecG
MTTQIIKELLQQGEGIEVEFKTARFDLNKDTFDSICAFLNRMGGHILFGVNDSGKVEGVIESCIPEMINNLITNANNPGKLYPPVYLSPQVLDYEGKKIIYLYIPKGSQVHNTNGKIFDRNGDGDIDISRQSGSVSDLYLRKQVPHSEDRIIPYFELADCNPELFRRIRLLADHKQIEGHPWKKMSDEEIVRSSGLYKTDVITGKSGLTLAAALLLGKDETILNALSHHKTDALLRVENLDRYDDRDDIRTNLIDSFDRLMAFIAKHLPDKFYLEGVHSTSLRNRLFREIVSNLLIHREFAHGFPAKLIIERDRVYTENWSRPHGWGAINPLKFVPFPKNPVIAKFFKEVGMADELGSGVMNVFKYGPEYTPGAVPELIEGDVFMTIIPLRRVGVSVIVPLSSWLEFRIRLGERLGKKLGEKLGERLSKNEWIILEFFWQNPAATIPDLAKEIGISTTAVENNIAKLKKKGILERIGSDRGGHWKIS